MKLTDEQINALTGRELDAAVAEACGWTDVHLHDFKNAGRFLVGTHQEKGYVDFIIPKFSTDIAAAWQVAEKLKADGTMFSVSMDCGDGDYVWRCYIRMSQRNHEGHDKEAFVKAQTAPLAICRALLKAVNQ